MTSDQLQSLRQLNEELAIFLERMNQPAAVLTSSDSLAHLLQTVVEAGDWIKNPAIPPTHPDGQSVLSTYRRLLGRLQGVLPLMEVQLRMERAQLESERSQLAGAAQWSASAQETLSTHK